MAERPRFFRKFLRLFVCCLLLGSAAGCGSQPAVPEPAAAPSVSSPTADSSRPEPMLAPANVVSMEQKPSSISLVQGRTWRLQRAQLIKNALPHLVDEARLVKTDVAVNRPTCDSCTGDEDNVYAQLDHHGPRPLRGPRDLTSLVPEDQEIAPGRHLLRVSFVSPEMIQWEDHLFVVTAPHTPLSAPPSMRLAADELCHVVLPLFTVNGSDNKGLTFLSVFESDVEQGGALSVNYQVHGPDVEAHGEFPLGVGALLSNAQAGDYQVTYQCKRDGSVIGESFRKVTFNPELGQLKEGKPRK